MSRSGPVLRLWMQEGTTPVPAATRGKAPAMLHPIPSASVPGALQPTRIQACRTQLARLDRTALASLEPALHPTLRGVRRFVEALLTRPSQAAQRADMLEPEVWTATCHERGHPTVVGLGWLAGQATEVIAAPGRDHDAVTEQLVTALFGAARARRLSRLTTRLSGPLHASVGITGRRTRVVAERDGALFLHLDLTDTAGD